jgi:hypothetical protein
VTTRPWRSRSSEPTMKIDLKKLKLVHEPEWVDGIASVAVEFLCALCNGPTIVRVAEQKIELYLEVSIFARTTRQRRTVSPHR